MARYTGPTTRINRRFGMSIFPPNKAQDRKPHPPGQHGPRLRRKMSDYSIGLNEKQNSVICMASRKSSSAGHLIAPRASAG
jgi:ribosomal protein S4